MQAESVQAQDPTAEMVEELLTEDPAQVAEQVEELEAQPEIKSPFPGDLSNRRIMFESRRLNYLEHCRANKVKPDPFMLPSYLALCVRELLQTWGQDVQTA